MKKEIRKTGSLKLAAVIALAIAIFAIPGFASIGTIVKSDLTGSWQIALRGNTGCGFSTMLATVTLGTTGTGTGTLSTHGQCGDSSLTGQTFTIQSLGANGSGTAGLTCGTGCGWTFKIQVSPDRSKINLVDVATINPGNYLEGEAVRTSPDGDVVTADLTGSWQVTILGVGGCGTGSEVVTFTLGTTGATSSATTVGHTAGCGDSTTTGNTFHILSMNANGSGTAGLSCGTGCGFLFDIQVSPDRSAFNLVDMTDPGNYLAGVALRTSNSGHIAPANLTGSWQLTIYGQGGCGAGSTQTNFTLNSSGATTAATTVSHTAGCGDSTTTGNTFHILSLNTNGSGTAGLSCGTGCGFLFDIQVASDRSAFNVVDVTDGGNYLVGEAIHQ